MLRTRITGIVQKYISRVNHEDEMKYLLLDKDFEHRDALDLITMFKIEAFLES